MSTALLNETLGSLATRIPGATRILREQRLDFCCGGAQSLQQACEQRGIDATLVAEQLLHLQQQPGANSNWELTPTPQLIEHILERYHARHREQLPELIRLANRVEHVHTRNPDCPHGLAALLDEIYGELEHHMCKEERILFPMFNQGVAASVLVGGPIAVMRHEHDQHGEALEQLAELTHDIQPPPGACNTWRALYRGLQEFRDDLMQHIHLENNILFPKAELLEKEIIGS